MMKRITGLIFSFLLGFILFLIAYVLFFPLTIINLIVVAIKGHNFKGYFFDSALNLDKYANREFRALWNTLMRKSGGYAFGKENETISSALGKNQRDETLSNIGRILCFILDTIDKKHCFKSISE